MLTCKITSPKGTNTYKDMQSVTIPAVSGNIQILPGHAELFALLGKGKVSLQGKTSINKDVQIIKGECYMNNDVVTIII